VAKLTTKARKATPTKEFAVKKMPGTGKKGFPLTDPSHDRNAISGATRSFNAGNISKSTENSIKSQARAKLGKGKARGR
jgi:hypothetical protein